MGETDGFEGEVVSGVEHDCPECPDCGGHKTRPMDDNLAHCFDCNIEWFGDFSELRQ